MTQCVGPFTRTCDELFRFECKAHLRLLLVANDVAKSS